MAYKLTLYAHDYVRVGETYETVKTRTVFNCDCEVQLLDLIMDMVKTSEGELDITIGREENDE